jgi:Ca-activated chloride channel family protein
MTSNKKQLWWISIFLLCLMQSTRGQNRNSTLPTFRADVVTVFIKASVTDLSGRCITGLDKQKFKLYEDNIEQQISYFSEEAAPISAGLIFDISGSMGLGRKFKLAKQDVLPFLESRNREDEYFLITFNSKVRLVEAFTNGANVQNEIALQKTGGWTSLLDAVYRGLDEVKKGKNEKKALILITDGGENNSRYTFKEVREFCEEAGIPIYIIGGSRLAPELASITGRRVLTAELASITGGRVFYPEDYNGLNYYVDLIHTELRAQYLLGYVPTRPSDGKWRKITIKLDTPPGLPKLMISAKKGYYAN